MHLTVRFNFYRASDFIEIPMPNLSDLFACFMYTVVSCLSMR